MRDLTCKRVQADEIWSYVYGKDKNLAPHLRGSNDHGSVWTFVALCPDCKLIPVWRVGQRDMATTFAFIRDLAERMRGKFQLSTDAYETYLSAIVASFHGTMIDYATIDKDYKGAGQRNPETRYSPGHLISVKKRVRIGDPDPDHISTSHVERANLTIRMGVRRFTRLTTGFSKRIENHRNALALQFFAYNFVRRHQTLRKTPAQAAGITNAQWTVRDILFVADSERPSSVSAQAA